MVNCKITLVIFIFLLLVSCSKKDNSEQKTEKIANKKVEKVEPEAKNENFSETKELAADSYQYEEEDSSSKETVANDHKDDLSDNEEVQEEQLTANSNFWGNYKIQVFAGNSLDNAYMVYKKVIESTDYSAVILDYEGFYKVFVGSFSSRVMADKVAKEISKGSIGITGAFKVYFGDELKKNCQIIEK